VKVTPLRASLAVVVVGLAIALGGLALGDAPTPTTVAGQPATGADASPDIIPDLGQEPEIVRGSPGSREQVALLGGLIAALGLLGVLGSVSADAARRARQGAAPPAEAAETAARASA
jgi:hypothetical protein